MFKHYLLDNSNYVENLTKFIKAYWYTKSACIQLGDYFVQVEDSFNGYSTNKNSFTILSVKNSLKSESPVYYKLTGWSSSYNEAEFEHWTKMCQVQPVEKTIIDWESV